ncbi:GNAT family N-acetyltransferase [Streptomyces sp. NBC_01341]|uniref:GNAT family N-acetyltransferase n=1 Tax=Streptomyces sp. NBC_01341 TaxID=2903831 RepID=UPI002E14F1A1|nr:GNAT family N-acetyltransferase [Streptomyces sp. NBC_01341]
MTEIVPVSGPELVTYADELATLLIEAVEGGASVGFLSPLDRTAAAAWWRERAEAVDSGSQQVWIARDGDARLVGTISLVRTTLPNARHRAEVTKLVVGPSARGRGIGRALLTAVEEWAAAAGLTLLVLDTETGSDAERLYRSEGWTPCGSVPDYAADPYGTLRATTFYYRALGRPGTSG